MKFEVKSGGNMNKALDSEKINIKLSEAIEKL